MIQEIHIRFENMRHRLVTWGILIWKFQDDFCLTGRWRSTFLWWWRAAWAGCPEVGFSAEWGWPTGDHQNHHHYLETRDRFHKETIEWVIHSIWTGYQLNIHIFILLGKYDSKYILLYLPAFCHLTNNATALSLLLPPSIFSSLLISMTTNFSHTANVGRVEEMNWPNLSGEGRKFKFSFLFLLSVPLSLQWEVQV